ncbi:MAG: NUDIX pyrophosphatase [Thermoprotei archaeon]|nr:MAG: NUDIX pyrophosphatase [Thermoprotei archaeon]
MRAEFQVLVIPFVLDENLDIEIAVFRRADDNSWQFIAGGGESGETELEAARREAYEEAGISRESTFVRLNSLSYVPRQCFPAHKTRKDLYVIPEYCFAVVVENKMLELSPEHSEYRWMKYEEAMTCLRYDSNKTALWELQARLRDGNIQVQ